MGGGGSTTSQNIETSFDMEAVNNIVFEQMTENVAKASTTMSNIQNLEVALANVIGCDFKFGQKISSEVVSTAELDAVTSTEVNNDIASTLNAQAQAMLDSSTQMGSELGALLGADSNQNVTQEVRQRVRTEIENSVKTVNIAEVAAETVNIQGGVLTINGYDCTEGGQLDFTQDISAVAASKAVTKAITTALASNEIVNALAADTSASVTKKAGGFAEVFDSIFGGVSDVVGTASGPAMAGMVASVICVCVIVLALLAFLLSPAGQNAARTGASAMAKRF